MEEAKKAGISSNEGVMSTMAVVAVETQILEQWVADPWKETLHYLQMNSNFCSLWVYAWDRKFEVCSCVLMIPCLPFSPDGTLLDVTHSVCRGPETNILRVMLYYKYLSQKSLKTCKHYSCWLGRAPPHKEKENIFSSINTLCTFI